MVSVRGPEFDAAMKALQDKGKPAGRMMTWYCPECSTVAGKPTFHVKTGRAGCTVCAHYEERIE